MVTGREPAAQDVSGHLNAGKAFEVRAGTGEPGPELGIPGRDRGTMRRGGRKAAVRATRGGIAGEGAVRIGCLFLPDQGN